MRTRGRATAAALAAAAALLPGPAGASEADAFENKVEPVSGQLYRKAARFELTPTVNMSVDDPFFAKYLFGAKVGYHLSEYFSLHASFATGPASPTGSTSICSAISGSASCRDALPQELAQVPGKIKMMGGAEVAFSPVYGKLNVLAEGVLHFDLSLMIGGDWISYQRVVAGDQAVSGLDPGDESTFGGHLGVGARIFLSRFIALRLEVKDYLYSVPIGNLSRNQLERQLFTELGLSFFFPTAYRAGP